MSRRTRATSPNTGIDFADSLRLFSAPLRAALDDRHDYGEDRWIGLGLLDDRVVAIAFVEPDAETVRVISMRRALAHERKQYEEYIRQTFSGDTGP